MLNAGPALSKASEPADVIETRYDRPPAGLTFLDTRPSTISWFSAEMIVRGAWPKDAAISAGVSGPELRKMFRSFPRATESPAEDIA